MATEFSPSWWSARMTKAQIKKYIEDMKKAQLLAMRNLEDARKRWDFKKEKDEVDRLANLLDDDSLYA